MMAETANPLVDDRDVDFLLYEVLSVDKLTELPPFADHSRESFGLFLGSTRRLAREVLFPAYRAMDAAPPELAAGVVKVHPRMHEIYRRLVELGFLTATRPPEVGGQSLPLAVATLAQVYLSAANLGACGLIGLTAGAAHLLEAFGGDGAGRDWMKRLYAGAWTGTMALTEPQAGSSLADVTTSASPTPQGDYLIRGSKIFISGGDHDVTPNIVHMVLARIVGAPAGIKGVSLFAVPKLREEGGTLVSNDVHAAGMIHKIGWRCLPSMVMSFGDEGTCRGVLVGEPHKGIAYMFQMMNEARILIGASGVASASVAYHEAVGYARTRPQGRSVTTRDPTAPQVAIVEHADVRRMLLRQKAIVEGGLALVVATARYADLAGHATDRVERLRAQRLVDVLTPIAKTFPAERGFEANVLALQVHGGYGYSSEYLPEAWLRDQKLNSIHEGTSGIQALDLLGRKVVADGGESLRALLAEVHLGAMRARSAGVEPTWIERVEAAAALLGELTAELAGEGGRGDVERMLLHSADYLELFSIVVVAWQWLLQAAAVHEHGSRDSFLDGKLCAAQYWIATELPRIDLLATLCRTAEGSYARMRPEWF